MYNIINNLNGLMKKDPNDKEYWIARDYQKILRYKEWRDFNSVIEKAIAACENNKRPSKNHFVQLPKMVAIGSGASKKIDDYALSRYACYLIAMNGSSNKVEVASAQEYFAVETRKSELSTDYLIEKANERITQRDQLTVNQKKLNAAAQSAGVTRFGKFQNKGYEAMYGGLNNDEIREYKGVEGSDKLFDRIGRAELAAHNFRATQAETRIIAEKVASEDQAINIHQETGQLVRRAMKEAGGSYPEDLPIEEHINEAKEVVNKYKAFKHLK